MSGKASHGEEADFASRNGGTSVETALRSTNVLGAGATPVDFYGVDELLTEEEQALRSRVREFVDAEVLPVIAGYWERAEYPKDILIPGLARLGVMGGSLEGYGCPGMSTVAEGLVSAEMARGDIAVFAVAVASGMVMRAIHSWGSEECRQRWLPEMAKMDKLGAFALTEPYVGSDAAHLKTHVRRNGDHYILNGAKRWIGNARDADIIMVMARDEDGEIGAFLVEKGSPGVETSFMAGKGAARVVPSFDVTLEDVRVPIENRIEGFRGFRDAGKLLTHGRFLVSCASLGQAMACYEAALAYAMDREQFGKPIASFQLVQQKLVWMLTEITAMQLLCWRLGNLIDNGRMKPEQASMAKMNNAYKTRQIAAAARDVMGSNGILLENRVIRQQADAEATFSFEGTDHVQTLVIGRKITRHNSFA
ncbi:acyl-CoA dehydrogenase [Rubrobacter xylanophilus]|uniref:Acyl-CoA dehydrogenase n=1 Tax=Rubrobacter xylanophilus TaxID=49319 RepID=A0A510HH11_9ACTN|nr:acyl-CoA dehydrogenase family protein [Rubrobacter xylanophilus]BBL79272.1 acyl-CoA dehydrogenase [Rubrobacter xylanophilus]